MNDLVAFLLARLDEDEAVARLAAREGGTWKQDDPTRRPGAISSLDGPVVYDEGAPDENQAPHIARHDPARVLREVAAKRAIIAACEEAIRNQGIFGEDGGQPLAEKVLPALAAVYGDHPGYDPQWACLWLAS